MTSWPGVDDFGLVLPSSAAPELLASSNQLKYETFHEILKKNELIV
jgi:hypothetical protein